MPKHSTVVCMLTRELSGLVVNTLNQSVNANPSLSSLHPTFKWTWRIVSISLSDSWPQSLKKINPDLCLKPVKKVIMCVNNSWHRCCVLFALIITRESIRKPFDDPFSADQFITSVLLFHSGRKQRRETCHILWPVTLLWTNEQSGGGDWMTQQCH